MLFIERCGQADITEKDRQKCVFHYVDGNGEEVLLRQFNVKKPRSTVVIDWRQGKLPNAERYSRPPSEMGCS